MAALYDLLSQVAPFVVDCPEGVQTFALRQAARRFLADSHAWVVTLTGLADGTDELALSELSPALPAGALPLSALALSVNGRDSTPFPHWMLAGWVLHFSPALAAGAAVEVTLALGADDRTISELPDALMARYGSAIADLALNIIYSVPARPYTDRDGAAQTYMRYRRGLHEASVDRLTGGRSGNPPLTNPLPEYF
jgi:hypothetical protein